VEQLKTASKQVFSLIWVTYSLVTAIGRWI